MRKMRSTCIALALGLAGTAHAIVSGQVDDFESGGTQGWGDGLATSPNPPTVVLDGGPLGAGDAFLRLRGRGGTGAGSKPTAFNEAQWSGNYTAAGVTRISADLNNVGPNAVHLRFQLITTAGKNFVTPAVILPSGSGWTAASWPVDAASLISVDVVPGDPAVARTQVTQLRLFHAPQPAQSNSAPAIVADYGIDNIRAEGALADRDSDGVPDASDNCPFFANLLQLDTDGNGRGNACECGDQSGDGTVDVLDLVAINLAIFNPVLRTPLCDANGDGNCDVADIVGANLEIFSAGSTSTCQAQPEPGP
jgi:hypothetical protein